MGGRGLKDPCPVSPQISQRKGTVTSIDGTEYCTIHAEVGGPC